MLTTVTGIYNQGHIILQETPQVNDNTEVIVTFLTETKLPTKPQRTPGGLKGRIIIPDDFNEPLEDLKDYM